VGRGGVGGRGGALLHVCVCWRGSVGRARAIATHTRAARNGHLRHVTSLLPAASCCVTRVRLTAYARLHIAWLRLMRRCTLLLRSAPLCLRAALRAWTACWDKLRSSKDFLVKTTPPLAGLMRAEQKRPHPLSHTPSPLLLLVALAAAHSPTTPSPPPKAYMLFLHACRPLGRSTLQTLLNHHAPAAARCASPLSPLPSFHSLFLHAWMNWRPPPPLMMSNRHYHPVLVVICSVSARAPLTPTGRSRRCRPC
jgi:hypothetical protein